MTQYFNIPRVDEALKNCLIDEQDVDLNYYLQVYQELVKFCSMMGNVFSFVKDEIESKSKILVDLKEQQPDKFQTLKKMINYELDGGLLEKTGYVSGSRTLLRLHWGLNFIRTFLRRVTDLGPNEYTNSVGKQVYKETLGSHHVWYVKLGASAAMFYLPTKKNLEEQVFGVENVTTNVAAIPAMLELANEVYERTEAVYSYHKLLDLP